MTIASRSLNQSKITSPSKFSSIGWIAVQNWVDRLIFPELKEDSSQLASARLLIVSTWAVLLVIVLSSIRDLLLGDIPRIWLACATAVPMFLLLRLLRRTGNLALCCNLFLTVIVLSLSIRTTLNPDGSQVMVSICALGLMAAHLISARVGFYWTLAATGIAAVNAWRLTISNSAEFEVAGIYQPAFGADFVARCAEARTRGG